MTAPSGRSEHSDSLEVGSTSALPTGTSLTVGAGRLGLRAGVAALPAADAPAAAPEPATCVLLGAGAVSLAVIVWRRRKQSV